MDRAREHYERTRSPISAAPSRSPRSAPLSSLAVPPDTTSAIQGPPHVRIRGTSNTTTASHPRSPPPPPSPIADYLRKLDLQFDLSGRLERQAGHPPISP